LREGYWGFWRGGLKKKGTDDKEERRESAKIKDKIKNSEEYSSEDSTDLGLSFDRRREALKKKLVMKRGR